MELKICTECGEKKEVDSFHFHSHVRKGGVRALHSKCKKCRYELRKAKIKENESEHKRKRSEYYLSHKEDFKKRDRAWRKKNFFHVALCSSRRRAKKFNYVPCIATVEELELMFTGYCAICGVSSSDCKTSLCLDHCHSSGRARGFICDTCNRGIGLLKDSPVILLRAAEYLLS